MTRSLSWLMVLLSCLALGACKGRALHGGSDAGTDATAGEPLGGGNSGGGPDATADEPLGGGNSASDAGTDAAADEPLDGWNSGSGTDASAPDSDQNTADLDAEEEAGYAALIGNTTGMRVITDQTSTGIGGVLGTSETVDRVLKQMHDVAPETTASFLARNATVHPLRSDMSLGVPYVLLSQAEMNAVFYGSVGQDGWQVFRARYPDAQGIQELSRVGFNTNLTQALVYLGSQGDWLAGEGNYYLMKKVNGVWTVDQTVMIWIS